MLTLRSVFTVILRRVFGVAGGGLVDFSAPANQRVAWPSGDWGSLPLAGGVEGPSCPLIGRSLADDPLPAAFKGIIEKAKTPEAQQAIIDDLTARLEAIRSPMRTAETFGVEEVIDPRETRPRACAWAAHAYANLLPARLIRVVSQNASFASRWRP